MSSALPKLSMPSMPSITAPKWLRAQSTKLFLRRSVAFVPFVVAFAVSAYYTVRVIAALYGNLALGHLPPLWIVLFEALALIVAILVAFALLFSEQVVRLAGIRNNPAQPWGYATAVEQASERFEDLILHSVTVRRTLIVVLATAVGIICYVA